MRVFVDTNSWLRCTAWRVDIWRECQRVVPGKPEIIALDKVLRELEGLKAAGGTLAQEAKVALLLLKQKGVLIMKTAGTTNADDALVDVTHETDFVLTQDQELKKRLKAKNVGVIIIRGQDHLELENR